MLQDGESSVGGHRLAALCGPPGFIREAERLLLQEFSFKPDELHLFQG
jgi:hypothetical protein